MTAVELPVNLRIELADYPPCEKRTERAPAIVERCAKPSEWSVTCNNCGLIVLLCDEHAKFLADRQKPQACSGCHQVRLVPLGWTFLFLGAF